MAGLNLFICYRRDDSSGHAGRIFDRLAERFGAQQVFRDVDTLAAGEDFVQAVRERIDRCDVLLALIGTRWLRATDADGRWRLADENDPVRVELVTALQRNRRIVPVLLQGATMPRAKDLPAELGALAQRTAVDIRDGSFDSDVARLIELLEPGRRRGVRWFLKRPAAQAAVAVAVAMAAGLWAYLEFAPSPQKSRVQIVQMGMTYDPETFVARAGAGDLQAVELFLRAGMAVDTPGRNSATALQQAVANGHMKVVQTLLDHGANGGKALPWAAGYARRDMLALLLRLKPDPEALGQALHNAAGGPHTDIVKTLLDAGADLNARGGRHDSSPLIEAADAQNAATVQLLLERGADVGLKSSFGDTALLAAVRSRSSGPEQEETAQRLLIARALLDKGAGLEDRLQSMQDWQPTPLLLAIDHKFNPVALLLIERGADVNAMTGYPGNFQPNLSALMWAAHEGLVDVVEALLAKGAQLEARNDSGNTALMIAAESGQTEIVRLLLQRGANAALANREGRTALMLAREAGQSEAARLLAPATSPHPRARQPLRP